MSTLARVTVCGVLYEVEFDKTLPSLTLTPYSASGSPITGRLECCDCNYAIFAFGGNPPCTDARDTNNKGCGNIFRLKVEMDCCPMTGWMGAGWYCVVAAAGDCADATNVELLDADKCRTDIKICSGPYSSETDASLHCSGGGSVTPSTGCDTADGDTVAVGQVVSGNSGTVTPPSVWGSVFHVACLPGHTYRINFQSSNSTSSEFGVAVAYLTPDCSPGASLTGVYTSSGTGTGGSMVCGDIGTIPDGAACICVSLGTGVSDVSWSFVVEEGVC